MKNIVGLIMRRDEAYFLEVTILNSRSVDILDLFRLAWV